MARDGVEVPPIMVKCCEAIEKYGVSTVGVYRIGGTMSKVTRLKEKLDKGACRFTLPLTTNAHSPTDLDTTNLDAEEWSGDISNVTSVLKLWLRELPEPLLTMHLHQGFLSAASKHSYSFNGLQGQLKPFVIRPEIENDRLRHIRLHERVNELPDANYATLKYFMGHLHRYVVLSYREPLSDQCSIGLCRTRRRTLCP